MDMVDLSHRYAWCTLVHIIVLEFRLETCTDNPLEVDNDV